MFTVLICLFAVTLSAARQIRPAKYSNGSLQGSYSFLTNKWLSDPTHDAVGIVGIMNFNGLGNVSSSFTVDDSGTVYTGTAAGTYSVASDGTGNVKMTYPDGSSITLFIVLNAAGKGFQAVQIDCSPSPACTSNDVYTATAVKMGASWFSNASLKGNFEWMFVNWTSSQFHTAVGVVGRLTFDGVSKVKGSITGKEGWDVGSLNFAGTYSVNSDGSGSMTMTDEYNESFIFSFVINSATATSVGKGFQFMLTGGNCCSLTGIRTGTGTKQ